MADKKTGKKSDLISTGYDVTRMKNTDMFDPVAWFEGTGEDLGLPADYNGYPKKKPTEPDKP